MTSSPEARAGAARWLRLIGPLVAIAILWRLDLGELVDSLKSVAWMPLGASLALGAPLFVIKAWRWCSLLSACGRPVPLGAATWLYTVAAGAASVTPGAIGDFWKGLSPLVGDRSIGLWTSFIDRLYDFALLLLLGAALATHWMTLPESRWGTRALVVLVLVAAWIGRRPLLDLAFAWLPRFPSAVEAIERSIVPATAATIAGTVLALLRFELLVVALRLPLTAPQVLASFVLTSGVAALPISVAGVGTRDLALLGYLRTCGIPSHDAVALSALCLALFLSNAVCAAVLWPFPPAALRRP